MLSIFTGRRPDITPAQAIAAAFASVGPIANLVGAHLSKAQLNSVNDLKVVALGLFASDAALRIGRNHADAKREAAALSSDKEPPDRVHSGDNATAPAEAPLEPEEIEAVEQEPQDVLPEPPPVPTDTEG